MPEASSKRILLCQIKMIENGDDLINKVVHSETLIKTSDKNILTAANEVAKIEDIILVFFRNETDLFI